MSSQNIATRTSAWHNRPGSAWWPAPPWRLMGPLSIRHGTAQHVIARTQNETRWVARVLAGTDLSHMAGRSLSFHSPVRFLFVSFPSHGKSADLCSWAWLRPWLSTPGSVSTWSAAVFTGPVSLTAQPSAPSWRSTDDLEGRKACRSRSCSWLFTGARQRLAVDLFPRGDSEV